jgi:phospholipase D
VPGGGYIYVVTPVLTDPRVAIELVRAKKRGVDVRVIADRQEIEEWRERVALYNLKHYGIPVKITSGPGLVELKVSIINDSSVVTGTYDYTPRRTPGHAPTVAVHHDNRSVQGYKGVFEAMWHDAHAYKML